MIDDTGSRQNQMIDTAKNWQLSTKCFLTLLIQNNGVMHQNTLCASALKNMINVFPSFWLMVKMDIVIILILLWKFIFCFKTFKQHLNVAPENQARQVLTEFCIYHIH